MFFVTWLDRLRQLGALPPAIRRALVAALILMPMFALGARWLGLRRVSGWARSCGIGPDTDTTPETASAILRGVEIARRHAIPRASCLAASLTLQWLLRRRGVATDLRIGVRLIEGQLAAHAWVERNGRPLNDSEQAISSFEVMPLTSADAARWA